LPQPINARALYLSICVLAGGVSRDESTEGGAAAVLADRQDYSDTNYDEFSGYSGSLFSNTEYDEEDRQADEVYESIDVQMDARRKSRR
jgi:pre-mRNA-processing factor 6